MADQLLGLWIILALELLSFWPITKIFHLFVHLLFVNLRYFRTLILAILHFSHSLRIIWSGQHGYLVEIKDLIVLLKLFLSKLRMMVGHKFRNNLEIGYCESTIKVS